MLDYNQKSSKKYPDSININTQLSDSKLWKDNITKTIKLIQQPDNSLQDPKVTHVTPNYKNYTLGFIDGGNAEIISAPKLSLQLIKTAAVIMKNNKIHKTKINKKLYLIKLLNKSYEITEIGKPCFNLQSSKNIQEIGGIIRNLTELKLYQQLQKEFNGIIIKDGGFEVQTLIEKQELNKIPTFCGLSKSSNTLTGKPHSIPGCWYINHNNEYYITKLNPHSKYAFKLELKNLEINQVIQTLISNSKDYIYPGYPYGLILVDQFARVTNQQLIALKTHLEIKMGKNWQKIQFLENSLNAHSILDKLVF